MRITFFLRITNLPHPEFGKFYNFIRKMASFRQFGKAHFTQFFREKYRILDQILPVEPWLKKRFPNTQGAVVRRPISEPALLS